MKADTPKPVKGFTLSKESEQRLREVTERAAAAASQWVDMFANATADSLEKISAALEESAQKMAAARAQEDPQEQAHEDHVEAMLWDILIDDPSRDV